MVKLINWGQLIEGIWKKKKSEQNETEWLDVVKSFSAL